MPEKHEPSFIVVPLKTSLKLPAGFRAARMWSRTFWLMTSLNCLLLVTSLPAATVTVNTLADNGPGSLRQALNNSAEGDTIQVTAQGTLFLTTGLLEVLKTLTITGPGTNHLFLDGQGKSPIFAIPP